MALVFRVNGVDIGDEAVRLGAITSGFISRAEKGTIGSGGLPIDDPSGSLNIVGLQPFTVDETSSSGGTRLFTGYLQDRTLKRGAGTASPSLLTGPERLWDCNVVDLNTILSFRVFQSAKRPNESVTARLAWLMGTPQMSLVADHGFIDTNGTLIGANDFTGNYPVDVLNDVANGTGWDYYLFYDQSSGDVTLFCGDATAATRVSTLAISNVLSDESSTILPPLIDGYLLRDPSRVFSGVLINWQGGTTYQQRTQTALDFGVARDVVISSSKIGKAATAVLQANQYLAGVSTEFDRISCTLKVPASQVNLIDAGMRINAKFTHLPGYETGKNMRIALRQVKADEQTDQFYNMYLELVTPIATNFAPFGNGINPVMPPTPPPESQEPACLVSLGDGPLVVASADGTYPVAECGPYDNVVASRLMCHDEGPLNPCAPMFGSTGVLFWGPTTNGREEKTPFAYTVPAGTVLVKVTALVSWDESPAGGSATAHGWHVNIVTHPPVGYQDGATILSSNHPLTATDTTVTTAYVPGNLFTGPPVYFITYPNWEEDGTPRCGVSTDPFPGGGYLSDGAVVSLTWMGFCDGAVGMANWVGGIGAVDGVNQTFTLVSWDGTGQPQAKVNGLPTPVTTDPVAGTATFNTAPAAGSLVTFNYPVNASVTPAPPPPNPGSIQALLDAAAAGATVTLTTGTYTGQNVTIRKTGQTLDMNGSTLDGGSTQGFGIHLTASGCTLKNGTVQNFNNAFYSGAISVEADGCSVLSMRTTGNNGAGIAAKNCANMTWTSVESDHNVQEGYELRFVDTATITSCHFHHNNPNLLGPSGETGGGKTLSSTAITFDTCESDHNGGPGIWFDVWPTPSATVNKNSVVKNCNVHHNWPGIMVEISDTVAVHDNAVWENGWTDPHNQGWGWPAGILVSTSRNVTVYNNTLGWNDVGISVVSQDRPDNPGTITGNYVHDNLVAATDVTGSGGGLRMEGWYQDWGGPLFTDHTNEGLDDRFYTTLSSGTSSDRYEYNGALSSIAAFQVTVGGAGATEVSSTVALAALTAAGIPTSPEHT